MMVLIKNIPADTAPCELRKFIGLALSGDGRIKKAELLILYDKQQHDMAFYGLVHLYNRHDGYKVIREMNGRTFKNKVVTFREYFPRKSETLRWQHESADAGQPKERRRIKNDQLLQFSSYEHIEVLAVSQGAGDVSSAACNKTGFDCQHLMSLSNRHGVIEMDCQNICNALLH